MKRQNRIATTFFALALLFAATLTPPAKAAGLVVNTSADNTTAGDTFCTLREAIINANADADTTSGDCTAGSGADLITFAGNYTITLGSGLPDLFTNITITGNGPANTIVQSAASAGIATYRVFRTTSTVTLEQMTIRYGVEASGGGINNANGGNLTLNYVVLTNNVATFVTSAGLNGGGISTNGGTVTLNNSTVSGNTATSTTGTSGNGGGIFSGSSTVMLNNSTVSGNSASGDGGGLYVKNGGTINVQYSTVTNNTSDSDDNNTGDNAGGTGGGIGRGTTGTFNVKSSIVAGNKKGISSPADNDCTGTITSQNYNLTGSGTGCTTVTGSNDITVSPSAVFTSVLESSLAYNGGATQSHALLAGSPAIDAIANGINDCGSSPFGIDQRSVVRPQRSNCDIGAYEQLLTFTMTAARDGTGSGTVTSSPAGISCGTTCAASFEPATSITLTAAADIGSTFTGWSGDCTGTGSCIVTMDATKNVTATFTLNVVETHSKVFLPMVLKF